jgi:hypothetical protein
MQGFESIRRAVKIPLPTITGYAFSSLWLTPDFPKTAGERGAADAVQFTIGYRNIFDSEMVVISHVVSRDERVRYLALERGCETVPNPGEADFELIDVQGCSPWFLEINLPRSALRFCG